MLRPPLALLVTTLLMGGCTHAPWNPYRGWRAFRTEHVTVYTDAFTAPTLTLEWMEEAYQALAGTFFQGFVVPPAEIIELDPAADSPFTHDSGAKKLDVAIFGPRNLLMVSGKASRTEQQHVLAHHFIEAAVPHAPLWFHEGFATYLSNFHGLEGQPQVVCFGVIRPWQVDRLVIEPLSALFSLDWKSYNQTTAPNMNSTAWSLIDYLLHRGPRTPVPDFKTLMIALRQQNTPAALATTYPAPMVDQLDAEVRAHVHRREPFLLCPLHYPAAAPPQVPGKQEVSAVDEAAIKAMFESLYALPDREGYADVFRVPSREK
jgi:hypothetical protein